MPRVVWFLWFQSLEDAPYIVRACYKSWTSHNPAWRVIALDEPSAADFASVDLLSDYVAMLSPQHKADLLRLNLLAQHGGVWADAYWTGPRPRNATRQFLVTRLTRLFSRSRRTRRLWFTRVVRAWLAVCPYFARHYAFKKLVHDDPACGHIWSRTPKMSADGPHLLHQVGFFSAATDALRAKIGQQEIPVLKLTRKLDWEDIPSGSALGYLLELVR